MNRQKKILKQKDLEEDKPRQEDQQQQEDRQSSDEEEEDKRGEARGEEDLRFKEKEEEEGGEEEEKQGEGQRFSTVATPLPSNKSAALSAARESPASNITAIEPATEEPTNAPASQRPATKEPTAETHVGAQHIPSPSVISQPLSHRGWGANTTPTAAPRSEGSTGRETTAWPTIGKRMSRPTKYVGGGGRVPSIPAPAPLVESSSVDGPVSRGIAPSRGSYSGGRGPSRGSTARKETGEPTRGPASTPSSHVPVILTWRPSVPPAGDVAGTPASGGVASNEAADLRGSAAPEEGATAATAAAPDIKQIETVRFGGLPPSTNLQNSEEKSEEEAPRFQPAGGLPPPTAPENAEEEVPRFQPAPVTSVPNPSPKLAWPAAPATSAPSAVPTTLVPNPSPKRKQRHSPSSSSSSSGRTEASSGRAGPSRASPPSAGRYGSSCRTPYPTGEPEERRSSPSSGAWGPLRGSPPSRPSGGGGREPSRPSVPEPVSTGEAATATAPATKAPATRLPTYTPTRAPTMRAPTTSPPTNPPSGIPTKRGVATDGSAPATEEPTYLLYPTYDPSASYAAGTTNDRTEKVNLSFPVNNDPSRAQGKKESQTTKLNLSFPVGNVPNRAPTPPGEGRFKNEPVVEVDVTLPESVASSIAGSKANEPTPRPTRRKSTVKLNLTFQVPDRAGKGGGEEGDDAAAVPTRGTERPTEDPTYFLYPSYSPTTAGTAGPTTAGPTTAGPTTETPTVRAAAASKPSKKDKPDKDKPSKKDKPEKSTPQKENDDGPPERWKDVDDDKPQKEDDDKPPERWKDENDEPPGRWKDEGDDWPLERWVATPEPTTAWPTYMPTTMEGSPRRPSKEFASGRDGFTFSSPSSDASPSVDVEGGSHGWTWRPTRDDDDDDERQDNGGDSGGQQQQQGQGGGVGHQGQSQPQGAVGGSLDALSSLYEKRICPSYPFGVDPTSPKREREVLFAYGVQTTQGKHGRGADMTVERVQLWILEDVARRLLLCDGDAAGRTVSRVYYVEDESVAALSECTPSVPNATDCAIVQGAIYLTADVGHEEEARAGALSVIRHGLEGRSYERGTVLHTSYLGPDLSGMPLFGREGGEGPAGGSSSPPATFYVAVAVASLALCQLAVLVATLRRVREARRRAASIVSGAAARSRRGRSPRSPRSARSTTLPPVAYLTPLRTPREHGDTRSLLGDHAWRN